MKPKPFEIIVEFTPQSTKTGITYEAHKKGSLIRCKDCTWYDKDERWCPLMKMDADGDEYCYWGTAKEKE